MSEIFKEENDIKILKLNALSKCKIFIFFFNNNDLCEEKMR